MTATSNSPAPYPEGVQGRRDEIIRRFEEAWRRGARPALNDFLPPEGPERHALLVELAPLDLERRLQAGDPARVESYLTDYPKLASDHRVMRVSNYTDPTQPLYADMVLG